MSGLTILNVVGCRPNFVKIAPLMKEMRKVSGIRPLLLHTGQHYDESMSDVFFQELSIPAPDVYLNVRSAPGIGHTAQICQQFAEALTEIRPDLVLVVGDVNSTMAAALTSVTLGFPVAHVEAGLRSFDREMPEEINRVVTDALSDFLFASEPSAVTNLLAEGKDKSQVFFSGNVMIDSLVNSMDRIDDSHVLQRFALESKGYALLTLHRQSNVDAARALQDIGSALACLQEKVKIVFPVHPRTAARLEQFGAWDGLLHLPNLQVVDPVGYIDFIKLMKESLLVLSDSGGVQEESTALGIPCLTLRNNTERPVTITEGTNELVGTSPERIVARASEILRNGRKGAIRPEKWDGHASERIVSVLLHQQERIKKLYQSARERNSCSTRPALQYQA